ncbi:hypothetical protein [Ruminococcus albus]|uniref:Conserved domain protein n=1 Tax=Ruminococcus albus 8 TaxID=246199 RepID=E9SDD4_RUMAL|nr:hypothetical protein [Ruminococcus albus]EGC02711.1 conserved domain protein [Ruminococcus albus 8]MBE6870070.1 hypothetical protein [Ruminococcus albus]MCC3352888.1 hypothetical protein [Ruminococcus albus 8]
MKKINVKQICSVARAEFISTVINTKIIMIPALIIFIKSFAIDPLLYNAELMGENLNYLEPFIAVVNSETLNLVIPLVFLALISNYPKIDSNTLLYVIRTGRINWYYSMILYLILITMFYLAVVLIGTIVPISLSCTFDNNWSMVVTDFTKRFPEQRYNFGSELLPNNLHNQLSLIDSAVHSTIYMSAYLLIIGLNQFVFALFQMKPFGFVVNGTLISAGAALCAVRTNLMWTMPMANSMTWMHFTQYFSEPVIPIWYSGVYFSLFIAVLLIISCIGIQKFKFSSI